MIQAEEVWTKSTDIGDDLVPCCEIDYTTGDETRHISICHCGSVHHLHLPLWIGAPSESRWVVLLLPFVKRSGAANGYSAIRSAELVISLVRRISSTDWYEYMDCQSPISWPSKLISILCHQWEPWNSVIEINYEGCCKYAARMHYNYITSCCLLCQMVNNFNLVCITSLE